MYLGTSKSNVDIENCRADHDGNNILLKQYMVNKLYLYHYVYIKNKALLL